MIKLTSLETLQLSSSAITISWKFESSTEDFNNYWLYLYQAQGPAKDLSEYDLIAGNINPASTPYVTDTTVMGVTDKMGRLFLSFGS